jgi:hypothetical protein
MLTCRSDLRGAMTTMPSGLVDVYVMYQTL